MLTFTPLNGYHDEAIRLLSLGVSSEKIAKRFHITLKTVQRIALSSGISPLATSPRRKNANRTAAKRANNAATNAPAFRAGAAKNQSDAPNPSTLSLSPAKRARRNAKGQDAQSGNPASKRPLSIAKEATHPAKISQKPEKRAKSREKHSKPCEISQKTSKKTAWEGGIGSSPPSRLAAGNEPQHLAS